MIASRQPTAPPATAFSHIRFSHPDQAKGDSVRRQTEKTEAWCQRNNAKLDTSVDINDLGVSAFKKGRGRARAKVEEKWAALPELAATVNPDRRGLMAFLEMIRLRKVPRGSYLILENLDRLSREDCVPAMHLLLSILSAGVRVVQLSPVEQVLTHKSDAFEIMRAVMELSRGNGESAIKSERVGSAWAEKRRRARAGEHQKETKRMGAGCRVLTRHLPEWIEERGGQAVEIPERAAVVKRIFALARDGYGCGRIVAKLTAEGVPAWGGSAFRVARALKRLKVEVSGKSGHYSSSCPLHPGQEPPPVLTVQEGPDGKAGLHCSAGCGEGAILEALKLTSRDLVPQWLKQYIAQILSDRRALGELQPRRHGEPDGDPVAGYFPAVVTKKEWDAARAGAAQRVNRPGRPSRHAVNVFVGLLKNARDGDSYIATVRSTSRGRPGGIQRLLITSASSHGRGEELSFPLDTLERAVLGMLWELNPAELLGQDTGPAEVAVLEGELARLKAKIAQLAAALEDGDIAALALKLKEKEAEQAELEARLAEARQEAATPKSRAWGEAKTLYAAQDGAPDKEDCRLRLRARLGTILEEGRLLVSSRGKDRLAAVQLFFKEGVKGGKAGSSRLFEILHRPPKGNKASRQPGRWWASSRRCGSAWIDLRTAEGAALALEGLAAFNPDELEAAGGEWGWDRDGCLQRSGIIGQPDDPGYKGIPLGRPRKAK
jgi:hypothetical protein